MAKVDDKHIAVARVYNQAFLNLVGDQAEEGIGELLEIVGLTESDARFARFLSSPLVDPEERATSLEKLFRGKASDLVVDTLQVLNRKGRLEILPTMAELCRRDHLEAAGHLEVVVRSAVALDDTSRDKLRAALSKRTGREHIDLIEEVDPTLLAGLQVRVGDTKLDGTARRELDILRAQIHGRAIHDLHESHEGLA